MEVGAQHREIRRDVIPHRLSLLQSPNGLEVVRFDELKLPRHTPNSTIRVDLPSQRPLPIYPDEQTFSGFVGMSQTWSLNDWIGARQERWRKGQSDRLCGFQIDGQLERRGLFHQSKFECRIVGSLLLLNPNLSG